MDTILYFSSTSALDSWSRKAAAVWNDVLRDLVILVPDVPTKLANIEITWAWGVRTPSNPTRIAECQRTGPDRWQIRLEASLRWRRDTFWDRVLGRGEDTFATLVHEFGHVFGIPHSGISTDVMHPEIGGDGKLSKQEKAMYRDQFLKNLEDEA